MFPLSLPTPQPDARGCIDILMGRRPPGRVPLIEYLVDEAVMHPIVTDILGREWVGQGGSPEQTRAYYDNFIAFWHSMGYDCVRFETALPFPQNRISITDTAVGAVKPREWTDEHRGMITSWSDFETYPWPSIAAFNFSPFEYLNENLPEGMGLISCHAGGILEHLSWIMSFEGLCESLHADPALVQAVSDRLGELMIGFYRHILDLENLVAVFPGDDMGYRSSTLVSPAHLRRFVLPWHKRFAEMAHNRGVPYFLHSCGRVTAIMEDLIAEVRIDGKHSFEDAIVPVQEFQEQFGRRIAVLGGIDVNLLASGTPGEVARKTRFLCETCGSRGRFAVGSGNSIPSYVPVSNYLAMVQEALHFSS